LHFARSGPVVAVNLNLHLEIGFTYLLPVMKDSDNLSACAEDNVNIKCVTSKI